ILVLYEYQRQPGTLPSSPPGRGARAEAHIGPTLHDGSRKLGLNDRLVRIVWSFSSETELLEHAFKINEEIAPIRAVPARSSRSWRPCEHAGRPRMANRNVGRLASRG